VEGVHEVEDSDQLEEVHEVAEVEAEENRLMILMI
jgi:hypothetical protein